MSSNAGGLTPDDLEQGQFTTPHVIVRLSLERDRMFTF
jgi:hypothetical protein